MGPTFEGDKTWVFALSHTASHIGSFGLEEIAAYTDSGAHNRTVGFGIRYLRAHKSWPRVQDQEERSVGVGHKGQTS